MCLVPFTLFPPPPNAQPTHPPPHQRTNKHIPTLAPPSAEFGIEQMGASGSTALVALIHPTGATFASLGDCLAVVCRGGEGGKVTLQHRVYGWGPGVMEGAGGGRGWGRRVDWGRFGVEVSSSAFLIPYYPPPLNPLLTPPEVERVESTGGWVEDGRVCNVLAVSRALGDPEFKV